VHQQPGQLIAEHSGIRLGREVAVVEAGLGVGTHHPVDDLLQAPLAGGGAERTAEVFGGDDRRGVDRPEVRELNIALLEDGLASPPVGLHNVAALPGDLVVRMHPSGAEDPFDRQPWLARLLGAIPLDAVAHRLSHFVPSSPVAWLCSHGCVSVKAPPARW
jgi:hypothetical protein